MKRSEVKKRAEDFCKDYGITEYPVEIVRVCNENGLKVFEEYLGGNVSGLIVVDEKKWEKYDSNQFISVNLTDSAVRRRFTIAHELAHFVLHKNESKLYAHRDLNNDQGTRSSIEQEANYFAANVLMPEELVKNRVEDLRSEVRGKIPAFVLVKEVADDFAVSESAAEVRLRQLGII